MEGSIAGKSGHNPRNMNYQHILDLLPYKSSFRFVDGISYLDQDKVVGYYTLQADAFFYADHFPGNPVTPGAILTEIMAQIGLVTLGVYLLTTAVAPAFATAAVPGPGVPLAGETSPLIFPLLTSAETSFLKMVLPEQKVTVISNKVYFRFDKLKCKVEMQDEAGEPIAKGIFAGIIRKITK
jgi:3-hydroxyacyl-[acyl-carrier-protein] dehydratase